jgi:uncharacterized protein YbbC (DUF1343 family)
MKHLVTFALCVAFAGSVFAGGPSVVLVGADILCSSRMDLLAGKRVGVITNPSARLASGTHLVDALLQRGAAVTVLFGPEHGIRGSAAAGSAVRDTIDVQTGLPVYSLYGAVRAPTPAMLDRVDILVYDIQDAGVRFYTYISTMIFSMEAAALRGIPFIVLDRPDPLGGLMVDGPVLPDSLRSFVGPLPIPVVYGMTPGELAVMANAEGWLRGGAHADLIVVPMEGWTRGMRWGATGREWIPPSPNLPSAEASEVYPAMCFLEATNFSEGRGTPEPFLTFGAPFVQTGQRVVDVLSAAGLKGVIFRPCEFTPTTSKHAGILCRGARISMEASEVVEPVFTGLTVLSALQKAWPDSFRIVRGTLTRLLGDASAFDRLRRGESPRSISAGWKKGLDGYLRISKKYRRYPDR